MLSATAYCGRLDLVSNSPQSTYYHIKWPQQWSPLRSSWIVDAARASDDRTARFNTPPRGDDSIVGSRFLYSKHCSKFQELGISQRFGKDVRDHFVGAAVNNLHVFALYVFSNEEIAYCDVLALWCDSSRILLSCGDGALVVFVDCGWSRF